MCSNNAELFAKSSSLFLSKTKKFVFFDNLVMFSKSSFEELAQEFKG